MSEITTTQIAKWAQDIMAEIIADIDAGILPADIATYTALHDHVDANDYESDAGVPWGTDLPYSDDDPAGVRVSVAVQDEVERLMAARLATATGGRVDG